MKKKTFIIIAGVILFVFLIIVAGAMADNGPIDPILVIASSSNPFTHYYAEILLTEGFNEFTVMDIVNVTPTVLDNYDVAILGELPLTSAQVTMLSDWVNTGGNLIAMRPDKQLAGLLGLSDAGSTLSNAYLLVNTASGPGAGIVNQTIQYHGTADLYNLNGATTLALLYSNATTATAYPAVTLRSVGSNGGNVAALTYDLARSVVYTRQGNPAWEGDERDGISPRRSDDMFYGAKSGDVQPDWIDLNKVAIPQADEQQRLLANMILDMNADKKPLPRFWYFPKGKKAAVIMTGDQHGCCGATRSRFQIYLNQSPPNCSLEDWECVRASSYVYINSDMSDAEAVSWTNQGFELGIHLNTGCGNWTPSSLDSMFASQLATFDYYLPSLTRQASHRTHCIAWSDWATKAVKEQAYGIGLDVNYYFWPPSWVLNRPGMFTGSGMPMRFATLDGTMIDCYQAVTQMTDESNQSYPYTINTLLDRALGPEGYYGAFTANMHTDSGSHGGSDAIVASALARGVPVVSGRQMLEWLDGRNSSSFGSVSWSGNVLSFTVTAASGARNLMAMVPTQSATGPLVGVTHAGYPLTYATETIKGIEYALFLTGTGDYKAHYTIIDTTPPTGTITINSGASYTNSTSVTLTLSCTDAESGCSEMQFSNDNINWSPPEAYATTKAWTLISEDGTKTVYTKFKDNSDNWSIVYSDTIVLDTAVPTTTATPAGGTYTSAQSVSLTCNDGSGSGCDEIYYTIDGSTPTTSSPVYSVPVNISTTTTLKFFAIDLAGHQESVKTEIYTIDTTPPTGTITINSGASYTNSTSVTLTLSCTDAESGCSQMHFSNNYTTWSPPEAYTTTKAWTLTSGDGTKTVYANFKDNAGNWSIVYSDTIVLDTAVPTTTATPAGGTYTSAQSVSLTCNDGSGSGCDEIYYTIDGSTPTTSSPVYSIPVNISTTTTLKFFATDLAGNQESVKTEQYTISIAPIIECSFSNYDTSVPRGGTLGFTMTLKNNTPVGQTFLAATYVIKPNENRYPLSGYLIGPVEVTIGGSGQKSAHRSHNVPAGAPLGTYTYYGRVGKPGVGLYHECYFEFEVTGP